MQQQDTNLEKLFSLLHSAITQLTIAEGIFKILTAMNDWTGVNDEERSKEFANQSYNDIFDYFEIFNEQIEDLELRLAHPAFIDLKELAGISNYLCCMLNCINVLGIQGACGLSTTGDYVIKKSKERLELHANDVKQQLKLERKLAA